MIPIVNGERGGEECTSLVYIDLFNRVYLDFWIDNIRQLMVNCITVFIYELFYINYINIKYK